MARQQHIRRTSRGRARRVEALEERCLLACDTFSPDALFAADGPLHQLQNVIDKATVVGKQIPFIGDQIADTVPFGLDVRTELASAFNAAGGEVEDKLEIAFNDVFGEANYAFLDQIVDVQREGCTVVATIDLSRTLAAWELSGIEFDVGLKSLPIYASAEVDGMELEMGFDMTPFSLTFDLDSGQAAFDTAETLLTFQLNASFGDTAQINAQVGFLQMEITDGLGEPPADDEPPIPDDERSNLRLGVAIAFGENFSVDSVQVTGEAALRLHMRTEVAENLPSISTDFILEYDLTTGDEPDARFENVSIGLGAVVSEFLGPVVDILEPVLGPIDKINGLLINPIPGLSDLGLGDVSVMDIANGLKDLHALPADYAAYVTLIDIVSQVVDIAAMFECGGAGCTDVMVNVGGFSLSDNNADLRGLVAKKEPALFETSLSSLSVGNFADLDGLADLVDDLDLPPGIDNAVKDSLHDLDEQFGQGATLSLPILRNPAGVLFQLLIGQNADLLRVDAAFAPGPSDVDLSGPIPIGIDGGLRGGFDPRIHLGLGYDTFGLRRFIENRRNGEASAVDFLDGFYITDDSDFAVSGKLEAFVALNAVVFSVEASGGINAGIRADVIGSAEDLSLPNEDNEPLKVRFLSEMGSCAFAVSGSVDVGVAITAKLGVQLGKRFLGTQRRWDIANAEVASFDTGCIANPYYVPDGDGVELAKLDDETGVLTLYAGPLRLQRSVATDQINEHFEVVSAGLDSVQVNAFGLTQVFDGVLRIEADMGNGFDTVTIAEGISADVEIHGGDATDVLRSFGSGLSTLNGDGGDDVLQGGTGANFLLGGSGNDTIVGVGSEFTTIEISGGNGDDVITGGFGTNLLNGNSGEDRITGGDGPNEIHGGPDDDTLFGGSGVNTIFGDAGNDRITAGPATNTIDGGLHDDTIFTGAGTSTVAGGFGDDSVSWAIGDGRVSFDGGQGDDSIGMVGSTDNDTFVLMNQSDQLRVLGPGFAGPVETISSNVEEVSVDGRFGVDGILVQPLTGTGIQRVNINLTDNLSRDGLEDLISIHGTPLRDELIVENIDVLLVDTPSNEPPVIGGVMRISGFRGHAQTMGTPYEILAMNFADRILVNTHDANDLLTVRGATGPTFLKTAVGDDAIEVQAVEVADPKAETGDYFSEIHVDAGSGSNRLLVTETGTTVNDVIEFSDSVVSSSLLPGVHYQATAAGSFGQGIEVVAGGQDDAVNITSTRRGNTTTINGSGGDDELVVDSNSDATEGDLDTIRGTLVLNGGTGHATVILIDSSDDSPSIETVIQPSTVGGMNAVEVSGFAGPSDNVPIFVIDHADHVLSLKGANNSSAPERFIVHDTILGETIIDDQQGAAEFFVHGTHGDLQIIGGDGDELVQITPSAQDWGDILGNVSIDAGTGNDRIEISDQSTAELTFYELTTNSLARGPAFVGTISFDEGLDSLSLGGAQANDVFTVVETPTTTRVEVNQGTGDNVVAGPFAGANWVLDGSDSVRINDVVQVTNAQTMVSGGGENTFNILPGGSLSGAILGTVAGHDVLNYFSHVSSVTIDVEAKTATNVNSFNRINQFIGSATDDILVGPAGETNWSVEGPQQGTVQIDGASEVWEFESIEQLVGGTDEDHFIIKPTGTIKSISGGGAGDLIDYAFFSTEVSVDLLNGIATSVNTLAGVENVRGGAGNDTLWGDQNANELNGLGGDDVLVGDGGNDTLLGSFGNDILIGGEGADTLDGGQDSDLLIAGATIYDRDSRSLDSIRLLWSDDDATYRQRIAALAPQNLRPWFSNSSVLSDTDVDSLFGGSGSDWFWVDANDVLNDLSVGELVD